MSRRFFSPVWVAIGCTLLSLAIPLAATPYILKVLIMSGIYIGLAASLNLIFGVAGQISLGHAAFYGIGAYTASLLAVQFHLPYLLCLIAGALAAAFIGYLLAIPTIRLKGIYLAVTTLAFGEIMRLIFLNWISVTRGPMGITGIPAPSVFGFTFATNTSQYYLMLCLIVPILFVLWRLSYSPFGMTLRAIRENEDASRTLGVDAQMYKTKAFMIGAGVAGLLGGFFSFHAAYIHPDNFAFMESITLLAMVVVGGMGSLPGVFVGALLLALAPDALRFLVEYRMVFYGLLLLLMILLRPQGLISESASISWVMGQRSSTPGNRDEAHVTEEIISEGR
ncbi:branched-chain amino acid ABC transporter permease [Brevibacillus sp. B_LB10_24]|uniref:branched-chain amino acid ABC transporter permease n=1 Tax=Brevibacillus sp. B_LB10_24 TaxID=3380645 RepID=UPI0038B9A490